MSPARLPEPVRVNGDLSLYYLETVGSTSTYLKEWSRQKRLLSGTALYAGEQTSGRGRRGNRWVHVPGNLAMTIWMTESDLPGDPPWTLKMAWTLLGYFSEIGSPCLLKYPNDIHLSSESGKVAGILVERINKGYLIGVGINRFPPEEVKNAAGWSALPDHHAMALSLSRRMRDQFLLPGKERVPSSVLVDELNRRLLWKGEWVVWKETGSDALSLGKIVRLDGTGRLEVSDSNGVSRYLPETVHTVRRVDPAEKVRP